MADSTDPRLTFIGVTRFAAQALCIVFCALILIAVGQPLFTDDLWWHLALGKAHLREGPWLSGDPLLFTAPGPPAPAAWLADVLFRSVGGLFGFTGLRILHVALVGGSLALAWSILRRIGGSRLAAWMGIAFFAALAAYRLVQLRPHLFSLLALLLLYELLFESERAPGGRRIFATGLLMAVWANLHSAFILGPALLTVALGLLALRHRVFPEDDAGRNRLRGLAAAWAAGGIGSLFNPAGLGAYVPYLRAGDSTPSLARVGDEWVSLGLLTWPEGPQPSVFVWISQWLLLLGFVVLIGQALGRWRRGLPPRVGIVDLAFAAIAFGFAVLAVRFVWLSILPIIAFVRADRDGSSSPRLVSFGALAGTMAFVAGFLLWGDWRGVTSFMPSRAREYAEPYPALKYHAHAVWLMKDAQLEGRLFNEYHLGGFLGYWLAPGVRTFLNGSLNVPREAIDANWPLRHRRGVLAGETFLEALDRLGIDLFMGIRTPSVAPGAGPWVFTSGHLERSEGWILGFRNLLTSLYLREGVGGAENLRRLEAYYQGEGVPFDPRVGFEPARVVREASLWARRHGVVPVGFPGLERLARQASSPSGDRALDRIASIYSILGEHGLAIALDRSLLERAPGAPLARRRLAWNLLHGGRAAEALAIADTDTDISADADAIMGMDAVRGRRTDPLLEQIADLARAWDRLDEEERRSHLATQPFLTPVDASRALTGFLRPPARPWPEN